MNTISIENIDLGVLSEEIKKHENEWIAVSGENRIVASGKTYAEASRGTAETPNVVLFKVPRLDAFLAP